MKKYYNYSPEIPTTDDNSEQQTQDPVPQPEQPVGRRRRPGKRSAYASTADKSTSGAPSNADIKSPEKSSSGFITGIKEWLNSTVTRSVTGILLGGFGFWFAVAFVSYFSECVADQSVVLSNAVGEAPNVVNYAGEGGARITEFLFNRGFGVGSFVIVVWLLCVSLKLLVGYPRFRFLDFTLKCLIAFITLSVVVGMTSIGLSSDVNWGGFHGRLINEHIYEFIGWSGAIIISVVLIAIFAVICLIDAYKWIMRKKKVYDEKRRVEREALEAEMQKEAEIQRMEEQEKKDEALSGEGMAMENVEAQPENPDSVEFDPDEDTLFDIPDLEESEVAPLTDVETIQSDPDSLEIYEETYVSYGTNAESINNDLTDVSAIAAENAASALAAEIVHKESPAIPETPMTETQETERNPQLDNHNPVSKEKPISEEKIEPEERTVIEERTEPEEKMRAQEAKDGGPDVMTVNVNQIEKGNADTGKADGHGLFTHEYKFPPADFLLPGEDKISVDAEEQMENKNKIRQTLLDFGIPITSIEATVGPTVTLYEIRPDTGVKIAKIRNLVDDIALSLAATGVRIIAPIPGKGTVGIEVANKDKQTVSMRTIIQSKTYQESKFKLPVALGSTISNDVYIADLAKMPHLLVAGATGQGKSVGLNAIVTSLLYSKRPEELKFVMVDPKRVEFSLYSKIENYYLAKIPDSSQPIITNMENVVATLSSLCVEMDERYKLLEKAFVRQVSEYNEKFRAHKLDPREGHRFMPYIVVIIDEFADLIMTAGKEVELPIARLAQLARAVGIHVIIATQRPSTNVITGMIKANFPVRIAFKVSSGVDSKTILDSTGAQQLIGRGDMLISNNGDMVRVQCAFVDTPEVEEVCDYISRQPYPQGAYILPEPQVGSDGDGAEIDPVTMGKKDPLLEEVARQVVMSGTASTSAVQRRYEIGYNRAGRIMDQLEALGVVGAATGGKPRNVLVDMMDLEDILSKINQ